MNLFLSNNMWPSMGKQTLMLFHLNCETIYYPFKQFMKMFLLWDNYPLSLGKFFCKRSQLNHNCLILIFSTLFADFGQPFLSLSHLFLGFGQLFYVSSKPFLFLVNHLTVWAICFLDFSKLFNILCYWFLFLVNCQRLWKPFKCLS